MAIFKMTLIGLLVTTLVACSDFKSRPTLEGLKVTSPSHESYVRTAAITVAGECRSGTTVSISGQILNAPVESACLNSAFSVAVTLNSGQGAKTFSVIQKARGSMASAPIEVQVTLDSTAPSAPTITSPAASARFNQAAQSIAGACETGARVEVTGNVLSPPATGVCIAGTYSVGVTFTNGDGTKNFSVRQVDRAGNTSSGTARSIVIDTAAPANPVFTTPASNNLRVNTRNQTVAGTCEAGAKVFIAGLISNDPLPLEVTCASGGTFSRSVTLTAGDGTKTITLTQIDVAGNVSGTASRNFVLNTSSTLLAHPASESAMFSVQSAWIEVLQKILIEETTDFGHQMFSQDVSKLEINSINSSERWMVCVDTHTHLPTKKTRIFPIEAFTDLMSSESEEFFKSQMLAGEILQVGEFEVYACEL